MEGSKAWQESFELMKPWNEAFNAAPQELRRFYTAMEIQVRMQHLHFERERLKSAYDASLAKIREHENNLVSSLRRLEMTP